MWNLGQVSRARGSEGQRLAQNDGGLGTGRHGRCSGPGKRMEDLEGKHTYLQYLIDPYWVCLKIGYIPKQIAI